MHCISQLSITLFLEQLLRTHCLVIWYQVFFWMYRWRTAGSLTTLQRSKQLLALASRVVLDNGAHRDPWPYFSSFQTFTCFEMGPRLQREEGSDYYWYIPPSIGGDSSGNSLFLCRERVPGLIYTSQQILVTITYFTTAEQILLVLATILVPL
jgi:hypothetical protein